MNQFKDAKGGLWVLPAFTLGLVFDLKDQAGVDFLGDDAGKDATEDAGKWFTMLYDPRNLGKVLWVIFEDEIKSRGLDQRKFARLCSGEVNAAARNAIVKAVASFIHSPKVAAAIESDMPRIEARIAELSIAAWKSTAGDLLESLGSIPAPSV